MKNEELQRSIKEIFIGKTNGYCISNEEYELNIVGLPCNRKVSERFEPQKIRVKYTDKTKKQQYQSEYLNVGSGYEFVFPRILDLGWNRKYNLSLEDQITIDKMIDDLKDAEMRIEYKYIDYHGLIE